MRRVPRLAQLEEDLGFRSSFNFIPEGRYQVPGKLRADLVSRRFEVGVHDLKHDGRLFQGNHRDFAAKASRINHYLSEWDASGFRAGFMLHNLEWLHDLDVSYDASTFDTDPFEPQPEGRHTIFPFWVERPPSYSHPKVGSQEGYVELPYTLSQDSTLFLLLGEPTINIWQRKVDWIAAHGGMVLLNTHPDYMADHTGSPGNWEYPTAFYRELLDYISKKYSGQYWHVLPYEMARYVRARQGVTPKPAKTVRKAKPKLWIDLDNTPHVPLFEPILEELMARGFPLFVTARDAFQVCELADKQALGYLKVGRHYGKNSLLKATGLLYRSLQLANLVLKEKPQLAISHGARSQLLLSNWLRIPSILMEDYEYSKFPVMMRPLWVIAPDVIPDDILPSHNGHVRKYRGIKEDIYAWRFRPNSKVLDDLGIDHSSLVITVRPPATEAHYHNRDSEALFRRFMTRASQTPTARVVLLPRNSRQKELIRKQSPEWFRNDKTIVPEGALEGLNLLWHSDLVVSGGGTMNREAAALGVPVYSIFRGTIGAVDRSLRAQGKLMLIETGANVDNDIKMVKRDRPLVPASRSRQTLHDIVDTIEEIAASIPR